MLAQAFQTAATDAQCDAKPSERGPYGNLDDALAQGALLEYEPRNDTHSATERDQGQDRFVSLDLRVDRGRDRPAIQPAVDVLPGEAVRRYDERHR
jgi:hypothetical protein